MVQEGSNHPSLDQQQHSIPHCSYLQQEHSSYCWSFLLLLLLLLLEKLMLGGSNHHHLGQQGHSG